MSDEIHVLLVIVTRESGLIRVAVKLSRNMICDDFPKYYKEPVVQAQLQSALPDHIKELGTIVGVM